MTTRALLLMALLGATTASADPSATPLPDPPVRVRQPVSLRSEATRVAIDMAAVQSRSDPDLLLVPWQIRRWSANGRAAKLQAGAATATFVGEMALGLGGSPLAALGAFAAGATLDAASADVEAASPPRTKAKPKLKHRLR
ncbi:hypothetical protein BH11MYX3_BH11MYX3_14870 [soil metagenome]